MDGFTAQITLPLVLAAGRSAGARAGVAGLYENRDGEPEFEFSLPVMRLNPLTGAN